VAEPGLTHSLTLAPGDVLADGVCEYSGPVGAFGLFGPVLHSGKISVVEVVSTAQAPGRTWD
jgi:hypothetical protein